MKKLFAVAMLVFGFGMVGCGGADNSVTPAANPTPPPATAPAEGNTPSMSVPE